MSKNNRQHREKKKRQQLAKEKKRMRREQSSANDAGTVPPEEINRIARLISNGPLGLVHHQPQQWAKLNECFDNAQEMVHCEGGSRRFGWMFHWRERPGVGYYVSATPHAVWQNPHDNTLVDVTPHPPVPQAPLMLNGSVLFLVDSGAAPVAIADGVFLSPPLRFFAVGDSPALAEYVAGKSEQEAARFERDKWEALARAGL